MRLHAILVLALAATSAASHAGTPYGEPMPDGPVVPVSQAIDDFETHAQAPRRFSGRITGVCQAKGCWMMLEDGGKAARVMFGDHAFSVPKDTTGRAVVHGVLTRKVLTPEQVEHLSGDSGRGVAAEPVEYRITADGIEIAS
ncbi:DUF4920 domain-containing protein [Luteimonas kalidii]|uniref:DUF4920 domain-containing protein n=1 Tax=Luteimonas kalidii TaxID=3042025 RepID=A0ABT6JX88_9GAMM|nr:DUF4920 domain-containing protein [Luteimonas kalidii]MDH5835301.1 DUF4920 domain-containing protein [Luteimonas kalidii]